MESKWYNVRVKVATGHFRKGDTAFLARSNVADRYVVFEGHPGGIRTFGDSSFVQAHFVLTSRQPSGHSQYITRTYRKEVVG